MTQIADTDYADSLVRYECGELSGREILSLYSDLIRSGLAWKLQGSYGRQARWFIDKAIITAEGVVIDPERYGRE